MGTNEIMDQVREYITTNFLYSRPEVELAEDDSLLATGVVDSMGVMEVIAFLEEEFQIEVCDADVTERNLGSLRSIAHYVVARRHASDVAA